MNATTTGRAEDVFAVDAKVLARVLDEGFGPGAWHGADLKAAIADVGPEVAFWRPAPGRHNIAEIVVHHAYCVHGMRSQLAGSPAEPFVLDGEDWFDISEGRLDWRRICELVADEHERLAALVRDIAIGRLTSPKNDEERFAIVLGLTCHADYHAGQIQLIKRLRG